MTLYGGLRAQMLTIARTHSGASIRRRCPCCSVILRRCIQAANELGDDIGVNSLSSRLVLLALHFPRLRLIWSRSLHATAAIFRDLKANMDEPDPVRAAAIGGSEALAASAKHAYWWSKTPSASA